jgi:4-amino-4-deoxy-L-arabinose transferase-like glycosyltransferase
MSVSTQSLQREACPPGSGLRTVDTSIGELQVLRPVPAGGVEKSRTPASGTDAPSASVAAAERRELLLLTAVVLVVRLVAFFLTQNVYGDAISRVELGEQWAAHPHWIWAFGDGAWQFGPLHLYLLGVASMLWSSREHAGRVVSLVAGVATTVPLWFLCRKLYDARAARFSCLVLAFWGMHIQFSTTAASEALSLLLLTACLAFFAHEWWPAAGAALTLACATRYDVWMLIPVLAVALGVRRRYRDAAVFGALALAFPLTWLIGNARFHGDAQYPAHYINAFHRTWFAENEAFWGVLRHRTLNLFFWPLVAAFTLTPIVAVAGALRARHGWLIAVAALPMIVFTTRSTLVGDFEPLARFTAGSLLVVIVWAGPRLRAPAVAVLALFTLALGAYTWQREGKWHDSLRPVSPVTTQPQVVMEAARQARACSGVALIAADPGYRDIAAAFYAGVPVRLERNGESQGDCIIRF